MPIDPRIEKVARAMAKAKYGFEEHRAGDPNGMGMRGGGETHHFDDTAWKKCYDDAKQFVAAHDAIRE